MSDIQVFDLYGFQEQNLKDLSERLSQILHLHFQKRNSDYWGDYTIARNQIGPEVFKLKTNYNLIDGEYNWPEHKGFPFILEGVVTTQERAREIETLLLQAFGNAVQLLRRNVYPAEDKKPQLPPIN